MTFPEKFDSNEWYIICVSLLMVAIFLFLSRRFSWTQIIIVLVFNFSTGTTADAILAGPPYDLYDIMDRAKFGYFDLSTYIIVYPLTAYVVIYFYDKWPLKGLRLFLYILGWTIVTVALTQLSSHFHVYTYKHWNFLDSMIVYFLTYVLNFLIFAFSNRYVPHKYV